MTGTRLESLNSSSSQGDSKNLLEIYTLGQFSVLRNGLLLSAASGRLSKAWELLLYLITNRQKLTPLETIHEILWPDEDCADPKKNIKNLVHRLRKTIDVEGESAIIYSQGCYRWNTGIPYWLDAEVFESLCQEGLSLSGSEPAEAVSLYKKALSLYRGDYLPEFSGESWVVPARRYFHQLFVSSVLDLLNLYKEAGD